MRRMKRGRDVRAANAAADAGSLLFPKTARLSMVNCDKFFLKFEKMFFTVCLNFSPGRCYNSYSG